MKHIVTTEETIIKETLKNVEAFLRGKELSFVNPRIPVYYAIKERKSKDDENPEIEIIFCGDKEKAERELNSFEDKAMINISTFNKLRNLVEGTGESEALKVKLDIAINEVEGYKKLNMILQEENETLKADYHILETQANNIITVYKQTLDIIREIAEKEVNELTDSAVNGGKYIQILDLIKESEEQDETRNGR